MKSKNRSSRPLIPKLCKTILQFRFKPGLKYYGLLYSVAEQVKGYPHWQVGWNSVTLRDYQRRCSVGIHHNYFSYEQDSENVSQEQENLKDLLSKVPIGFHLDSYLRIGYRRKYLVPVDMTFPELVSIFNLRLFSKELHSLKGIPSQITDLLYRVDCAEEGYHFHVTAGPVHHDEIPIRIEFNYENHLDPENPQLIDEINAAYPNTAIFIDIDMYRAGDNISSKDGLEFLNIAPNKVHEITKIISSFLLSEGVAS